MEDVMDIYSKLKELNSSIPFHKATDAEFVRFGKVFEGLDFSSAIHHMDAETGIPAEGNVYVASCKDIEEKVALPDISSRFYQNSPIQVGYCNGRNSTLNGLEYHMGSEVFVAVTNLVLLLGSLEDVKDGKYDVQNVQAFYVEKGTCLEICSTTLHFAPCKVDDMGFKSIIILLKGTNTPLDEEDLRNRKADKLLFAKNKWLIAHPERKPLMEKGAFGGIIGENIEIKYP
jgi:hypothetical protein